MNAQLLRLYANEGIQTDAARVAQRQAANKLEELELNFAALQVENERLKTVPMKYRRMKFNAELQAENERLRRSLRIEETERDKLQERINKRETISQWRPHEMSGIEPRPWYDGKPKRPGTYDVRTLYKQAED